MPSGGAGEIILKIYNLTCSSFSMRTLNISISDLEYNKFGIKEDKLSFSDFIDIIRNELAKQTLDECVELAEKYGLSKITMDETRKK